MVESTPSKDQFLVEHTDFSGYLIFRVVFSTLFFYTYFSI